MTETRIPIDVEAGKFIPFGHAVASHITETFSERQCVEGLTWKHVDDRTKKIYWDEFVKKYSWPLDKEEVIKEAWEKNCKNLYRRRLYTWRELAKPPAAVNSTVWAAWKQVWGDSVWQKKSEIAKKNRNTEPAGPGTGVAKHTGGSRSYIEHAIQMRKDLKRDITSYEMFKHTHIKRDGNFVDAKSKALDDDMKERILHASQPVEGGEMIIPSQEDIDCMYFEAAGGIKKKRIYGIGSRAPLFFPNAILNHGRGLHTTNATTTIAKAIATAEVAVADAAAANVAAAANATKVYDLTQENAILKARLLSLENLVKDLVAGYKGSPSNLSNGA